MPQPLRVLLVEDNPDDANMVLQELTRAGSPLDEGGWDNWVPQYLERHCERPRTHERYLDAWKWLAFWPGATYT